MNPLSEAQKASIIRRIEFIEIELSDFEKYKDINFNTYRDDRRLQREIERMFETIANACINISKIIIAGENVRLPESYREVIIKLSEIKVLEYEFAEKFSDVAELRNILAHEYVDIRWRDIKEKGINKLPEIRKFLDIIKEKVKQ